MSDETVLLQIDGSIATITLNRPDAGNTLNLAMAYALLQHVIRCDSDPAIRCVVLTGAGKLFCGGGDVSGFATAGEHVSGYLSELAGILHMACSRLMRMAKPLVVLVNGPAAGAGFSLAISGDVVLASASAHFTAAYAMVGLTPDGGMSWTLPRLVGVRKAQDIILTNRRVGAEEAAAIGLVTRTVDGKALAEEGLAIARKLAESSMTSIAGARALLLQSFSTTLETQLELEVRSIAAAGDGAESREGVAAFLERRKPDFSRASAAS